MRCIRAVKSLRTLEGSDIQVVALYTEADHDAPFVRHADVSVQLPVKGTAVGAYLDHDLIIRVLKRIGADAVWPGWGFVAEDSQFVERVTMEGIRFLGPTANTMRALGDKIASKLLAESVAIPVTSWSGGVVKNEAEARKHGERLGYPLVIKASAGGGGRGIRVVRSPEALGAAFHSALSEAIQAFGDGRLFIEQLVEGRRHIEVQIVADQHGNIVALGCRDCSVQRRHQKVIEEAPPAGLSPLMIHMLKDAAVRLAHEVCYHGVGTVEFLVSDPEYAFLEMNPRLQVEHGITEEITGTDLVQLQIRIARGERLPTLVYPERGFAIEARVCAEDPDQGFLPTPGRVARFDPALGPQLRIDTGVSVGSTVPAHFDSLITKVIASGDSREEACARLVCALRDFDLVIAGGATNKGYLLELLETEEFKRGGVHTGWLDQWHEQRAIWRPYAAEAFVLAAILSYQKARDVMRTLFYADAGNITQEKIPASVGQDVDLTFAGRQYRARVFASGSWRYRVDMDGHVVSAQLSVSGVHAARLCIGGRDLRVLHDLTDTHIRVEIEGVVHKFGRQTAGQVRAVVPSLVVAVFVKVGDRIEAGQSLGVLEAMKMEIGFDAPVSGIVTEVYIRKGQQVAPGDRMIVIDAASKEAAWAANTNGMQLPDAPDPLRVLFRHNKGDKLSEPDLMQAAHTDTEVRSLAMGALNDEIRYIVLGYDTFQKRVDSLIEFLEAPIVEGLPEDFLAQLAELRSQLTVFADVENLFTRLRGSSARGELDQSNHARLRTFVRRMRAAGAGLPAKFLEELRRALSHYDYAFDDLKHSDALERAVLRLFASQCAPQWRWRLMAAVIHRVMALADAGMGLEADTGLRRTLKHIAGMRGQVPDDLADLALEASYRIFQRPEIERATKHTTQRLENWLQQTETTLAALPADVLADLALMPSGSCQCVERWLSDGRVRHRAIALSAFVRRLYIPKVPPRQHKLRYGSTSMDHMELTDGFTVLSQLASADGIERAAHELCVVARDVQANALELVVTVPTLAHHAKYIEAVRRGIGERLPCERFTISLVVRDEVKVYDTWVREQTGAPARAHLYGLHPEAAERVDLQRYQHFELDRLPAVDGVYCFYGKSRELPEDERIFVLVDVQGCHPEQGQETSVFVPIFEHAFYEATRSLRLILGARDPKRRLQWNRIAFFLAHPVVLDRKTTEWLAYKLYPATRHLGLERVMVRLRCIDPENPEAPPIIREIVVSDLTDHRAGVMWREPHTAPLVPISDYVQRVVAAKRRRLIYPYEIIRMLAPDDSDVANSLGSGPPSREALPFGCFAEYDLDPASPTPRAISVASRAPGLNTSGVVFGVISTPTKKIPEGMQRVLVLSDPTRDMGALAAPECDRIVAAINLAEQLRVPVEWLPISSGARIAMDSGTENLDATARVVRRIVTFSQAGGVIHVIITGVNVGAQSYWDSLATMLQHTRGVLIMTSNASMVLTGRAALAASGSVSAESEVAIGGYERIMGPNGQAQYYAEDLTDAYHILYDHYSYTYVVPGETGPRILPTTDAADRNILYDAYAGDGFAQVGEIFDNETNPGRKKPFSMRAVMRAIIDQDGGHLERWQSMVGAETAIVWDAHLGGYPICLIGIEGQNVPRWGYRPPDGPADWTGGTLFPQSSKKIARALNVASGNRPVVILANLSGFDGSPESMRKLQLEYGAEIARAVVNFEGPILFLVVSRYHGGAYVVFSRELNPNLRAMAVEGSYASVIGGGPAAVVVFPRQVHARAFSDPRMKQAAAALKNPSTNAEREAFDRLLQEIRLEKQAEVAAEFDTIHSVERALKVGSLEEIIPAEQMRAHLIRTLKRARG